MKPQSIDAPMGVGFVGAGYIASWHADALKNIGGVRLAGVHDLAASQSEGLAAAYGGKHYPTLDAMLEDPSIRTLHVLTPPTSHIDIARRALLAGKHVFVEKPMALAAAEIDALAQLASERQCALGVNHNFLMLPGYAKLMRDIERGVVGPIDALDARWRLSFEPMRAGPFGMWMLRRPENILFEIGSHLFAFIAHLLPDAVVEEVEPRYPIETPAGTFLYQGYNITLRQGATRAVVDLSFIEGHEDRSLELRGLGARARYDFGQDVYFVERAARNGIVLGPLAAQVSLAGQALRAGIENAARQAVSLNRLAPYGLSMARACEAFYLSAHGGAPMDARLAPQLAARACRLIEQAVEIIRPKVASRPRTKKPAHPGPTKGTMLVIGGTGFIGRALVNALVGQGYVARVFSRGSPAFGDASGRLIEHVSGDLKSEEDLTKAMAGVDGVFHLARANEKTWEGYLANDVAVTRLIGECCLKAGVPRLVYAGTIDSYDASRADRPISEESPLDPAIEERNLYSRSKTACEVSLMDLASRGLKLVIVRPGIVVGRGGPLKHWGIAMWHGPTDCSIWGAGDNILPFVGVDDCADGFVRAMIAPGVEGQSFNLVGDPMLTAQQYFAEIGKAYGVSIRARPTPLWRFYAVDLAKYAVKKYFARKTSLVRPSLRDWRSRGKFSPYRNEAAKRVLGWRPETDRAKFIRMAIVDADLFGVNACAQEPSASPAPMKEPVVHA